MLPYFKKLERDLDFNDEWHGQDGPIPVRRVPEKLWPGHARALAEAFRRAGYKYLPDQNGLFEDGYFPVAISNANEQRVSASIGYLDADVRQRQNLTISTQTQVTELLFEDLNCVGIKALANGQPTEFRGREIILSAGAIHSPAHLLRAGIGPTGHLHDLGIPVRHALFGVGQRLMEAGGESLLVSASTLYNEISRLRPDLMPTLMRGYRHSRRNQRDPGQAPVMEDRTPVFSFIDGVFHNCYSGISITASLDQGETHTAQERAGLACLDEMLARSDLALAMEFRKGDIQLVNNFTMLHSREAFIDHRPERRRHLLRLWLTNPASKYNGPGKMDFYLPKQSHFLKTRGYAIFATET